MQPWLLNVDARLLASCEATSAIEHTNNSHATKNSNLGARHEMISALCHAVFAVNVSACVLPFAITVKGKIEFLALGASRRCKTALKIEEREKIRHS